MATTEPAPFADNTSSRHCPHLGLIEDPSTWCLFPFEEHACHAGGVRAWHPTNKHQAAFCLAAFDKCPHAVDGAVPPPAQETPRRRWRAPVLRLAAAALLLFALFALALVVKLMLSSSDAETADWNAAALAASATATATATATSSPTATATATPLPTATPVPPVPTPEPVRERVHVVLPGESLWGLAEYYGVPLAILADRNGLATDARLSVGIALVIPEFPR